MNKYTITIEGCGDNTIFEMKLNEGSLKVVKELIKACNKKSTSLCQPTMYIELNKK